jgi:uncharacterized protein (TIGR00251 family)
MDDYYQWQDDDLILCVYVQPKASKNEFCDVHGNAIKVRITAPPVDGKANQQLIQFLSKSFKVSKSQVHLLNGETSRQKRFRISSPKKLPEIIPKKKSS